MLRFSKSLFIEFLTLTWQVVYITSNEDNLPVHNDNLKASNTLNIKSKINTENKRRNVEIIAVETAINEKIKEIEPFLQDNDLTIIIEKPILKSQIHNITYKEFNEKIIKYKKLRNTINSQLKKEDVSEKTRIGIMKTIDHLIEKMVNNKCSWRVHQRTKTLDAPEDIIFSWSEEWEKIRRSFINTLIEHRSNVFESSENNYRQFLDNVLRLFKFVTKDVIDLPKRYQIICSPIHNKLAIQNQVKDKTLRIPTDGVDCDLKVCSTELKSFMIDFYERLDDSVVSVLSNYAEMYIRDVNDETEKNKNTLKMTLKNLSKTLKTNVAKLFIEETKRCDLSMINSEKNKRLVLSNYVKTVTENIKENVKTNVLQKLQSITIKSITVIKEDIVINSAIDIDNIAQNMISNLCDVFQFCNERFKRSQQNVTVKNNITSHILKRTPLTINSSLSNMNFKRSINEFKYSGTFLVTRTTLRTTNMNVTK